MVVLGGIGVNNPFYKSPFGDTVAVIYIQGEIAYSQSSILGGEIVTPETIIGEIKQAEADNEVSAILLDVNSPGGSPVASEEIMNAVKNCKKPVVVWISDVGASGAYLTASAADKIVASPTSMVGSIGVLLDVTDLSGLYQKIGVNRYAITGGEYKDMGADYRNLTSEEQQMMQEMVDQDYDYFITLVAQNRNLDKNYVSTIAEGKIYTGTQAKDIKLIDETGGKQHAMDLAAELGGIKGQYKVMTITPPTTLEDVVNSISTKAAYSLGRGIGSLMQEGSIQYVLR
jgi:protease IV